MSQFPQIKMAQWPKADNKEGKTAFWAILRGGVRVQAWHVAVCLELVFGRLSVMTTQSSRLAQVGRGVLSGQRACLLMS